MVTKVLNVVSEFSSLGIDTMPLLKILKLRKSLGVTPEILVFGGPVLHKVL